MTINDATLSSDIWTAIKAKIVASSITIDGKSVTVAASYNDTPEGNNDATRKVYAIVHPIEDDEELNKFGSTEGKKIINVMIDCMYKNTKFVDQLKDAIKTALKSNDITGIDLIGVSSSTAFFDANVIKYQENNLVFTYQRE